MPRLAAVSRFFRERIGGPLRRLSPRRLVDRFRRTEKTADAVRLLDEKIVSGLAPRRLPTAGQLKFLPRILNLREKLLAGCLLLILIASSTLLILRLIGRFTKPIPVAGGSYVEGVVGNPQYVNPVFASGNDADDDLIRLVFAGLFRSNEGHYIVPDLAESFSVNPEGTVYTVVLKDGLLWSDGQPLTIDDVLFTFALIQDGKFKSPLNAAFRGVTIERVDARTVTFALKSPLAPFLSSLTVGIIPEHKWRDIQPSNARLNKLNLEPVGAGPYKVGRLRFDASGNIRLYELIPNPHYYGDAAKIGTLTLNFFPDTASALDALRGKKVEGLGFVPPEDRSAVQDLGVHIIDLRLPQYVAIFFNQKRAGLKSPEIREALTLALNRPEITREATNGTATVIDGPLPPGFAGATPAELIRPYDAKRAEELLDQAGWKKGDDGVRRKGSDELAVTLTTSDRTDYAHAADLIRTAWQAIGVKTEVNVVSAGKITREVIRPRNYDAILFSQILGGDPDLFPFWHSSQETDTGLNLAIFFKKETDKLLEDARKMQDAVERTKKYAEFQKQLNEALPAVFLWQPSYLQALPKKVKGFRQESLLEPADRFSDITHLYIKTKRKYR